MNEEILNHLQSSLLWFPEFGVGMRAPDESKVVYTDEYIQHYEDLDDTDIAERLNDARVGLVRSFLEDSAPLVDIGVGSGAFLKKRPGTLGYDVAPKAVEKLKKKELFFDVEEHSSIQNVTFWDSLEHILDPVPLLQRIRGLVFVSMPVYLNGSHVLVSKHYKPNEHIWYFTQDGLEWFMDKLGFELLKTTDIESQIGRVDILSFVFRRRT